MTKTPSGTAALPATTSNSRRSPAADVVILTSCPRACFTCCSAASCAGLDQGDVGHSWPVQASDRDARRAALRALREETGVDAASLLTQFGAYMATSRARPRMIVVTVAYLAVLRDLGSISGGSDAAAAALMPVSAVLNGKVELAFDTCRSCATRSSGLARSWRSRASRPHSSGRPSPSPSCVRCTRRSGASSWTRRTSDGALSARKAGRSTGRRSRPGSSGGRPAELYKPGKAWRHGGPSIERNDATEGVRHASCRP